jgi:hypothetical protein
VSVRDEVAFDMAPDLPSREAWRASATLERGYGFLHDPQYRSFVRRLGPPA